MDILQLSKDCLQKNTIYRCVCVCHIAEGLTVLVCNRKLVFLVIIVEEVYLYESFHDFLFYTYIFFFFFSEISAFVTFCPTTTARWNRKRILWKSFSVVCEKKRQKKNNRSLKEPEIFLKTLFYFEVLEIYKER